MTKNKMFYLYLNINKYKFQIKDKFKIQISFYGLAFKIDKIFKIALLKLEVFNLIPK